MSEPMLVVGGGAAGAGAAILLARAGRRVTLIEQHREPRHKVCGEFLSTEACASLALLGVDLAKLGATPVDTVRLAGGTVAAEAALPFRAMSLTRRAVDEALLRLAIEAGVDLMRGARVESITSADERRRSWCVQLSSGDVLRTSDLFLATGKHDLRGHPRPAARGTKLVAFKQYFRLAAAQEQALDRAIELILFRDGYAGLQMVEGGVANLCLVVAEGRVRAHGGWLKLLTALCAEEPLLRERLHDAEPQLPQPLALSHIPYGFLARPEPTFWRVGDQAAVIPSFTGDGISIALHSARIAVACSLVGSSPADAIRQVRQDVRGSMQRAGLLAGLLLARPTQPMALRIAKTWPGILPWMASTTRIPETARMRLRRREQPCGPLHGAYNEQG